jgi:hypothetical protein
LVLDDDGKSLFDDSVEDSGVLSEVDGLDDGYESAAPFFDEGRDVGLLS